MNRTEATRTLGLVIVGFVLGVILNAVTGLARQDTTYASLPRIDEPALGAVIADAIRRDDSDGLLQTLGQPELLVKLHGSITPIVNVTDVKFVGATEWGGRIFAAYTVRGYLETGPKFLRGFVLNIAHNEVVGIN